MKQHLRTITCSFILGTVATNGMAQEAVVSGGGEATGNDGSVSYTIGQVFYLTSSDANASSAEGVQQAYEISEVAGISEHEIDLSITTYPNPVQDELHITFEELPSGKISYEFIDSNGKLIRKDLITSKTNTVQMDDLPIGQYLLVITFDNNQQSSYKIIKH